MTEVDLVRQGSELLQIPLEQLVRSGAILLAKREILTRTKYLGAGDSGGAQSPELPRSGVAGSADNRIKEAFEFLLKAGRRLPRRGWPSSRVPTLTPLTAGFS